MIEPSPTRRCIVAGMVAVPIVAAPAGGGRFSGPSAFSVAYKRYEHVLKQYRVTDSGSPAVEQAPSAIYIDAYRRLMRAAPTNWHEFTQLMEAMFLGEDDNDLSSLIAHAQRLRDAGKAVLQ